MAAPGASAMCTLVHRDQCVRAQQKKAISNAALNAPETGGLMERASEATKRATKLNTQLTSHPWHGLSVPALRSGNNECLVWLNHVADRAADFAAERAQQADHRSVRIFEQPKDPMSRRPLWGHHWRKDV